MFEHFDQEAEQTMTMADFLADLRLALTLFETPDLERLRAAMNEGRLISGLYKLGNKRCLFGWLASWESRQDCMAHNFPDKEHFLAVRRTIRAFDRGLLTPAIIARVLAETLADRQALNHEEDAVIRQTRSRARHLQPQ